MYFAFVFYISLGGMRPESTGYINHYLADYLSLMIDGDEYGAVGGMRFSRGNWST
jgi:hypothetical protein